MPFEGPGDHCPNCKVIGLMEPESRSLSDLETRRYLIRKNTRVYGLHLHIFDQGSCVMCGTLEAEVGGDNPCPQLDFRFPGEEK